MSNREQIVSLSRIGLSSRKISKELGVGRAEVIKTLKESAFLGELTPSLELKILTTFDSARDIFKVATKLNVSAAVAAYVVSKRDPDILFTKEVVEPLYQAGSGLFELSLIFNRAVSVVRKLVDDSEVRRLEAAEVNDSFFSPLDNAIKAYWLGFIFADGWVTSDGRIVGVKLSSKDGSHVEKLAADINYRGNIYYKSYLTNYGQGDYAILNVVSRQMNSDLQALGCLPTKTTTASGPEIRKEFRKDFIRGIIDGDGTYSKTQKRISFSGTAAMVSWVSDNSVTPATRPLQVAANTWTIYWHGKAAQKMYSWMFDGAERFLDRKYEIAKEVYGALGASV